MQFQNEISINCPYCGETLLILIDDSGGEQSYYEDCSVCCAPMLITVTEDNYSNLHTEAKRDDE